MHTSDEILNIIDSFSKKKIMMIGDIVADEYIFGMTSRVSREAPVLILKFDSQTISLGGAGNAINNVRELGADVLPIGVVGDDTMGNSLIDIFEKKGIETGTIIKAAGKNTTTKTRILAGGLHTTKQQVIRVDKENSPYYGKEIESIIIKNIEDNIDDADAVIVSDYSHGVLSDGVIDFINGYALKNGKIISVDSRHNFFKYKNVTSITPNEPEVEELLNISLKGNEHIPFAGKELIEKINCDNALITRGKKGMVIFEKGREPVDISIYGSDEVADVTGAGDTVISVFTLGLVSSLTPELAARLSNLAGGIVVMKSGTAVVTIDELKNAVIDSKLGSEYD